MLVSDILLQLGNLLIWAFGIIADSTFWGQWCACWASATGPKTIRRQRFLRVTSKSLESAVDPSHFGESSGCWPILTPKKTAVEKLPLADLKRSWVSHLAGSNSRAGLIFKHPHPSKKNIWEPYGSLQDITRHMGAIWNHLPLVQVLQRGWPLELLNLLRLGPDSKRFHISRRYLKKRS